MPKLFLLSLVAILTRAPAVAAMDLVAAPDACAIERLRRDPYAIAALNRPTVTRTLCWSQDAKLLTAASILTRLIRNRTATFTEGTSVLDLSVASLTGYRLESVVRFWENDRVFLSLILTRRAPLAPDPVYQVWEISPNHALAQ